MLERQPKSVIHAPIQPPIEGTTFDGRPDEGRIASEFKALRKEMYGRDLDYFRYLTLLFLLEPAERTVVVHSSAQSRDGGNSASLLPSRINATVFSGAFGNE